LGDIIYLLCNFSNILSQIWKYHDGYSVGDPHSMGELDMRRLFYPRWWLKVAGFWSKYDFPEDDPYNPKNRVQVATEAPTDSKSHATMESEDAGIYDPSQTEPKNGASFMSLMDVLSYIVVALIAGKLGAEYGKRSQAPADGARSVELGSMSSPYMGRRQQESQPINSSYQSGGVPQVQSTRVQMEC
jgi:hypothetical protein